MALPKLVRRITEMRPLLGAFGHRNFRLFWTGAFISQTGSWMQIVAQGWLMFKLTNSPFWLGLDVVASLVPMLLLTLAGGVFADVFDRRRMLILLQALSGLFVLILAVLVSAGAVKAWMLLLLSFSAGSCQALASPSWQAFLVNMVDKEQVGSAIALNSVQFQLARVIGPMLAGLTFETLGVAGCFYLNGLSYIVLVGALLLVHLERTLEREKPASGKGSRALWQDLVNGFRYVRQHSRVFTLLLITFVTSFFSAPYYSTLPVFARDILQLDASGLAYLMMVGGIGAVSGALSLAVFSGRNRPGWFWLSGACVFAAGFIGFGFSTHLNLSLVFIFSIGFAITCYSASANTLLQKLLPDEMRGRVASMYILAILGGILLGSLVAGYIALRISVSYIFAFGGLVIIIYVPWMVMRNKSLRELLSQRETPAETDGGEVVSSVDVKKAAT